MLTGYTTNLPSDTILDMGTLYVGSTKIGATRGAPKWEPGDEYMQIPFDGKQSPIKLLDRVIHGVPKISGALMELGDVATGGQLEKLIPGSTSVTAGVTPNQVTTITPPDAGTFLAAGNYLTDVRLVFERMVLTGAKKYAAVYLPFALIVKWDLQGNPDGDRIATINFEMEGRLDSTAAPEDPAYKIELRESVP